MKVPLRALRLMFGAALLAVVAAVMIVVLPAAARGKAGIRLDAKVVATNPGPLPACAEDLSDCTDANVVREFIYVENGNPLLNQRGGTRDTVPNGFVVGSIDQAVFVDGVQDHDFDFTFTPPPFPSDPPRAGRWPMTVTCPPEGPPSAVVGSPAVVPGEEIAVFWTAWAHGNAEPNGTYVFKFTIHGTLNGTAVTLRANSPPIVMTAEQDR